MRLALIPLRLALGKKNENARTMATWIEHLHSKVDLLVFPKIPFESLPVPGGVDDGSADQADLIREFAAKRSVYIAAGLHHTRPAGQRNMLLLADRTGQAFSQNQRAPGPKQDAILPPPMLLNATVGGLPVTLTHSNAVLDEGIFDAIAPIRPRLVIVSMALAGDEDEHRRVAPHNPPRTLAALKAQLARLARAARARVYAVNAIAPDTEDACGPCGGLYVFDNDGELLHEQRLYDEAIYQTEVGAR